MLDTCNSAFNVLTTAPVLAFPDLDKPSELICGASGFGSGAVLLQEGRALGYYASKMMVSC